MEVFREKETSEGRDTKPPRVFMRLLEAYLFLSTRPSEKSGRHFGKTAYINALRNGEESMKKTRFLLIGLCVYRGRVFIGDVHHIIALHLE